MSMNQYMHPRNIYKQPPDFKQLAIQYPEFRKHATQDITGRVTIDFKNVEALRALTCTLLKKDFGLDLEIPADKLIPTVPLRLNYISWIEDLLDLTERSSNVKGIDIGTGASCIYPLLAARKNKWAMVATEIDPESIKYAINNVKNNNLEDVIEVFEIKNNTLLEEVLERDEQVYDFCMCNPPFFANEKELHPFFKSRKSNRPHPKNAFCASVDEVVAKGGEVEYITRLINESKRFDNRVKIFTTMIGHKSSLPQLKKHLREVDVVSFKQTEFCQGHTTRWGLAWTFQDIDLTKIPDSLIQAKQKLPKPLVYQVPKTEEHMYKVSVISDKLVGIFKDLEIEYQRVKHVKGLTEYIIVAYSNTWSHQRRRRREKLRQEVNGCDNNNVNGSEIHQTCDKLKELEVQSEPKKRALEEKDCGFYKTKKLKTEQDKCVSNSEIYLKAKISVIRVDDCIGLELTFYEGTGTKEALHQVLQYIKNNLNKGQEVE